nr:hypothetical protein GCM10020093_019850 [Planobispora longispora]
MVVVDVALTETGRLAHYVLPASTQFEKWEATFFNFEFPGNTFHLRAPVLDPLPGTLPEPEIYSRLLQALGAAPRRKVKLLRTALRLGRPVFKAVFAVMIAADRSTLAMAPYLLYQTLGRALPDGAQAAAVLWGLALRVSRRYPQAMRRAGHRSADDLFTAILENRSGVTFTLDRPEDAWAHVRHTSGRIPLHIPELLDALAVLPDTPATHTSDDYPFILAAGQRRASTANTIFRDTTWRLRERDGTLRISPGDAERLGLIDGATAQITTSRGTAQATVEVDDRLQAGHAALPNGFGLDLPTDDGGTERTGVALNTLTDQHRRDPFAATPGTNTYPPASKPSPADGPAPLTATGPAARRLIHPCTNRRTTVTAETAAMSGLDLMRWVQKERP